MNSEELPEEDEEEFTTIKPSRRKWPVSDPMAMAYAGINIKKEVVMEEQKTLKGAHKKGNEFDSCEVAGIPAHFKLDDWLFIGKVAREIERLAGVR